MYTKLENEEIEVSWVTREVFMEKQDVSKEVKNDSNLRQKSNIAQRDSLRQSMKGRVRTMYTKDSET